MKDIIKLLKIILFLGYISLSLEACTNEDEISINALDNDCKKITEVIGNKDLPLTLDNLFVLAGRGSINTGGYELKFYRLDDDDLQSHNIRKSNLYIPKTCMDAMSKDEKIKLDKTKGIVIIVYNSNKINRNNIPENYFVIRHLSENSQVKYINSKNYDLSLCHKDPILFDEKISLSTLKYNFNDPKEIDIDKIMYAKKLRIDLFDPHSDFLNDICFAFTSEYGTDVTLDSRLQDYYQNITLCDETASSHYMEFNYSETEKEFTYRCAYGFYESEEEKQSYVDSIDSKINVVFTSSNLKVINCFSELFNVKNIITNYGFLICFATLLIQIILHILFCCKGTKPLELQIEEMAQNVDTQNINKATVNPNGSEANTNNTDARLQTPKDQKDEPVINSIENNELIENNEEKNEEGQGQEEKKKKKKKEKKRKKK